MDVGFEGIVRSYKKIRNLKVLVEVNYKKLVQEVDNVKMVEVQVVNFIPVKNKKNFNKLIEKTKVLEMVTIPDRMEETVQVDLENV